MKQILIIGAGRSASSLIQYLIQHAKEGEWHITIADQNAAHAEEMASIGADVAKGVALDASNAKDRSALIAKHDLVISMLPATMHLDVVKDCIALRKHVITPSYVSNELWALDTEIKAAGIIALNELGLDPGIDHMSAMRILDRIREQGGRIDAFESHTGGLVAPESDNNPWNYKFSWNPRNVVLAGQGGAAMYIRDGRTKYIPYHKLFQQTQQVSVPGYGDFDAYANRDSLKYRAIYGLEKIPTLLRGTLRKAGYCAAWDVFVQLGCTDDSYKMELGPTATWTDYLMAFLPPSESSDLRTNLANYIGPLLTTEVMGKLEWLGLFDDQPIGVDRLSPAATLQSLLERKWVLGPEDKDLIVMWHRFVYELGGKKHEILASLAVEGQDQRYTGMAKTVGLPVAIAAKMVLNGTIKERGVMLPLTPSIYNPILDELEEFGIVFKEVEI
ncbi:MAG TPA: saccharopine dehydrogenase C-terminal domain-containing protein [Flavobacteriales bacterium]|nr:saccharopine dehydrogenase C-terminal domain-containing protein [Flavobacteriales bacterium]